MGFSYSYYWFHPFNLAVIALSICVLSGCRAPSQSAYYMYSVDGSNITQIMGRNCKSCDFSAVPNSYAFGLSGVCRSTNGTTECQERFPNSFDISAATFADVSATFNANDTSSPAGREQYDEYISATSINHSLVRRLSTAVSALLIFSAIISFACIPLSFFLESAFSKILLIVLFVDACAQFAALGMSYSIFRNEVASAYAGSTMHNAKYWPVNFGLGFWLLVGSFLARLLSNPILFIGFVSILLVAILLPIILLLLCCAGSESTYHVVYVPVEVFVN